MRAGGGGRKIRGVVIGIVTNIKDPDAVGRVKVRFPWMDGADDPVESHWARLCGWYAGNSRGTLFVPEIDDEVLIAFEGGDPNHPYILGAVFNGEHEVPGPGNPDGENDHKWFRSRSGHDLEFLDSDGAEKIRLVDSSQNNSIVYDTAGDTWTTEAKTGTINVAAPEGFIHIDCVDFTQTTTKSRTLEVGETHTITVGQTRTLNVDDANWVQMAGTSYTVTTPKFESKTKTDLGVSAGAMVNNQGSSSVSVGTWAEVQQGPVVRTAGTQSISVKAYTTTNSAGDTPATMTLLAGSMSMSSDGGVFVTGGPTTLMGGMINAKGGGAVIAKDIKGAKSAISTWLGGLLMLNPNALTFPATKLLDPIVGMDFHGPTLPAPVVPPLPPLPIVPMPFGGPILIDFKATVLINFMPACGSGATAIGFHMPPLPWPWIPLSYRGMFTSAIMALAVAPFTAMLEMGKAKAAALAAASGNPTLKRGFIADFIGSSHVQAPPATSAVGDNKSVQKGDQGTFKLSRLFPMFQSAQSFIGFLAGLLPLPVATGSVLMNSPTTSVCDAPLGMMIPMGANSCCDVPPIVPNAMVVGFSNVLTGMSIGDFLGQLAWSMATAKATQKIQGGIRSGGDALARKIAASDSPGLKNTAQVINDFVGGKNCVAEGHPVDVVSGTMFTEAVDFELFGAQTATWKRFYNAKAGDMDADRSALGPGWRHSLDQVLIADESDGVRTLALRDNENKIIGFDLPMIDGETDFHPYLRLTLTRVDGRTYSVRDASDTVRVFRFSGGQDGVKAPPTFQPPTGKIARLVQLKTPVGGEGIRPHWNRTRLTGFTDACGREVICKYHSNGLLQELRLKRSQGKDCDIFLARYRYDADGRLIAHEDRNHNLRWYRYDHLSRMTLETDRNGYSFHFHYDALNRCTHTYGDDNAFYCAFEYIPGCTVVGDALGGVTRYRYDDQSFVTEVHDAEGGITISEYTDAGWLATKTDPNGGVIEFSYDERGNVVQRIDPLGNCTEYIRDHAGHAVQIVDALSGAWRIERDPVGRVLRSITPIGSTQACGYDALGRLSTRQIDDAESAQRRWHQGMAVRDILPGGMRLDYRYDPLGRLIERTRTSIDGESRTVKIGRDPEGRITEVDGPTERRERYDYLPEGQPTRITVGGRTARRRYEGFGRMVEHTDPLGRSTRLEHDPHHRVTAVALPAGRRWGFIRDRLGRTKTMRSPDGTVVRYRYDPGGRAIEEDHADFRIERTFDANGNPLKVGWGDGVEHRYAYDALNRMTEASADGHRTIRRAFDADGRLVTETQGDHAMRWRYDKAGRVVRRNTTWGTRERFQYGESGLTGYVDPTGGEHVFQSDNWGRRTHWEQAGGGVRRQAFDGRDRIVSDVFAAPNGDIQIDRQLTWSEDDTLSLIDEKTDGARVRHQYRYDAANRLRGWQRNDRDEFAFELDETGNLLRDREGKRKYEGDRLSSNDDGTRYRYDARGRMIGIDERTQSKRLWFNARDRLSRVHTADNRIVHHHYDAVGRLSETVAETADGAVRREIYYWDGNALARRVVLDHADDAVLSDERYAQDPERMLQPLLRVIKGGPDSTPETARVEYFSTDQRGAVVRLSDEQGQAVWQARYDPYGRVNIVQGDGDAQPLRMLGQVHVGATGLSHHRFRVYDPEIARFVSPDPLGIRGGNHAFAYPDNPLLWSDPLGLTACAPDDYTDSWAPVFHGSTSTRIGDDAVSARVQNNVTPAAGFHDVVVHGQAHDASGSMAYVGDATPMHTQQVATAIQNNPNYNGEPIRAVVCHGANGGSTSMAADLSKTMGVPVIASSNRVMVDQTGSAPHADSGGQWTQFNPDGTSQPVNDPVNFPVL